MWVVRNDGTSFDLTKADDFATFDDLRAYALGSHAEIHQMLDSISDAKLADPIRVPWFKDPPFS